MRSTLTRMHSFLTIKALLTCACSAKAIWDFEGINCTSRHIPGVKFAGLIHPGILGCAPSPEILAEWNRREQELIDTHTLSKARVVALPPLSTSVHAGSASDEIKEKVGKEGARTVPGRPEHGGNCDIKNLSRGSKVYLPVHVKGAKFSVGDLHFSQGDGEISFCGAIEIAGEITINFKVMKGGQKELGMVGGKSPIYIPGPVETQFGPGRYIYFEVTIRLQFLAKRIPADIDDRASQLTSMASNTTTTRQLRIDRHVYASLNISNGTVTTITRSICCSAVRRSRAISQVLLM